MSFDKHQLWQEPPSDIVNLFMPLDITIKFRINEFDVTNPRKMLALWFLLTDILPSITPIVDCDRILFSLDEVLARIWNTDMAGANSIAAAMNRHLASCSTFKSFDRIGGRELLQIVDVCCLIMYSNTESGKKMRADFPTVSYSTTAAQEQILNDVAHGVRNLPLDAKRILLSDCKYGDIEPNFLDMDGMQKVYAKEKFANELLAVSKVARRQRRRQKRQQQQQQREQQLKKQRQYYEQKPKNKEEAMLFDMLRAEDGMNQAEDRSRKQQKGHRRLSSADYGSDDSVESSESEEQKHFLQETKEQQEQREQREQQDERRAKAISAISQKVRTDWSRTKKEEELAKEAMLLDMMQAEDGYRKQEKQQKRQQSIVVGGSEDEEESSEELSLEELMEYQLQRQQQPLLLQRHQQRQQRQQRQRLQRQQRQQELDAAVKHESPKRAASQANAVKKGKDELSDEAMIQAEQQQEQQQQQQRQQQIIFDEDDDSHSGLESSDDDNDGQWQQEQQRKKQKQQQKKQQQQG